ncbi:19879_t:CDS:2 [Dentiscutata erythropus]|uniref:19879_t:CDS:1 n=1 Tax=Dentiscutata erythropus TaxID=1348616 RepID=A0A9N9ICC7_9GLOM|nr:19879_t:CDS:2 [Dentiscutata erythropus]
MWSEDEIVNCHNCLYDKKISQELLKKKFELCSGIAGWIFNTTMSLEEIKTTIDSAFMFIDSRILEYPSLSLLGNNDYNKLIHIHANFPSNYVEVTNPYINAICFFASKYMADKCLDKLKHYNRETVCNFIENTKYILEMGDLHEQLFEMISHANIYEEENFFDCVEEIKKDENYYWPTSKNFESIDSYIHPNKLFQVTVAKRHSIKQDGLRMIKGILNKSHKAYENKRERKVFDTWISEIDQYALCLDLNQDSSF